MGQWTYKNSNFTSIVPNTRIREITKLDDVAQRASRLKWKWGGHVARLQNTRWAYLSPWTETSRQTWNHMGRRIQESGRRTLDQDRREPQRMATPRRHQQHQGERPSASSGNE